MINHLDLFTGYGGFSIPAEKYNIKTIGHAEIDKYASGVLKYRFPNIPNFGDVSEIKARDFSKPIHIVTGGTPCQDLSVAGKGAGLDGTRSGLFFHFIRLVKEIQPTYLIWENVKGAFSSQKGWDFATVQIEMAEAGYDVQWLTLNAKDYGVPQNRERVFIIGTRTQSSQKILRIPTLATTNYSKAKHNIKAVPLKFLNRNGKQLPNNYVFTIDTANTGGIFQDGHIRKLMPVECERLMGLQDNWTQFGILNKQIIEISDTQRYKMCGNGVVVNIVDFLYEQIFQK